jgi:hypothetical protein
MSLVRISVLIMFCVSAATTVAVEPKSLILQTEPEPTVIELIGNVGIAPATGNITAVPADPGACSGTGSVSCDDVEVETSAFSVTPTPVVQGQNVRFSWSSRGAWACESSGFGGWENSARDPFGNSVAISTADISIGNHTASLTCYNGPVTGQTRSVSIEVIEPDDEDPTPTPTPAACEGRGMPSTWNRMTTGGNSCHYRTASEGHGVQTSSDCRVFEQVYPFTFDDKTGNQRVLGMPGSNGGRHYIAMEFNSGNTPADAQGILDINQPQSSNLQLTFKYVSISKCPGDFDVAKIEEEMGPGCIIQTSWHNFAWGGSNSISNVNRCGLEPNTTYYLNIVHTNSPLGTFGGDIEPNPTCASGAGCGARFTWF